jgi:hypothetical protein
MKLAKLILSVSDLTHSRTIYTESTTAGSIRQLSGQEESFVAAASWTFVRLLRFLNGRSTTDDVSRVIGLC